MHKIFWLDASIKFLDRLLYTSFMKMKTSLCSKNPEHAARSRWPRLLKVIGPVRPKTDFEWTVYRDLLVSREIADAFLAEGFSGMKARPVEYYSTTETPFGRDSCELYATGWGGVAPPESGIHVVEECSACDHKVFAGYSSPEKVFNIDGWDGSDVFITWPLPRYIMVTARVHDFILGREYSGVTVRPLAELPEVVAGTLSPGSLRDWFDDARVKDIAGV